jgi:hypothetical protein
LALALGKPAAAVGDDEGAQKNRGTGVEMMPVEFMGLIWVMGSLDTCSKKEMRGTLTLQRTLKC